ncbi:HD-GYP domain-containing protein [Accumulibacter sp.]|uniref:HD-GYP domain-containing protein n=1 Tax=Accumulibacter sp. TaxID=2053492 RepID=UPI0025DC2E3F|nr:HD domain-containing phosphohydrolase [Accumulibacter sp.]MCM8593806.1 Hpt domain-containing protein [Accumulibacter sp.]MCM8626152.1 Hpt domain-containing protein [Accumulibacter sp.]MDS4047947.1 HD domain-containing phosphohydrolase [Accumulibacter sp.]
MAAQIAEAPDDASLAPVEIDREALQDFLDSLHDSAPSIERDVAGLRSNSNERELIGRLFRALHNIKGDAAICQIDLAVALVHPVETILARVRRNELSFSDALAELILLVVDRLELALTRLSVGERLAGLHLASLIDGLDRLAEGPTGDLEARVVELIEKVTGFRPAYGDGTPAACLDLPAGDGRPPEVTADLRFFYALARQFESRSPLFRGRTTRLIRLALETNRLAGEIIDPQQLEAAVYAHDIGMMFLAESAWLTPGPLSVADRRLLHAHPGWAAGLLSRMDGWSGAAEMVLQHHETPDGQGYPGGLREAEICPGARLLAIIDAFEAIMLRHNHRGRNRSVLRAVAEINACDLQFASEWIGPFNQVIRASLEAR